MEDRKSRRRKEGRNNEEKDKGKEGVKDVRKG